MTPRRIVLATHAQVVMDPTVPVPDWGLSVEGRARYERVAGDPALNGVSAIYAGRYGKTAEEVK